MRPQAEAFSRQLSNLESMSTVAGSFTKKEQIYGLLEQVREQMVSRQVKALQRLQSQVDYKAGVRPSIPFGLLLTLRRSSFFCCC